MAYIVTQPCITEAVWGSQTLQRLAMQLQYFNQLPRVNEEIEKDCCGIGSDFGLFKSVEVKNDQSSCVNWRGRRAAVLICLFEGPDGELRVILTKRSMKLSSHPGKFCVCVCVFFFGISFYLFYRYIEFHSMAFAL